VDKKVREELCQQSIKKGIAFLDKGDVIKAVKWFNLIEQSGFGKENDKAATAYYKYGKILLQEKDFNGAARYFNKARMLAPQDQLTHRRSQLIEALIKYQSSVTSRLFLTEFAARLEISSVKIKNFDNHDYLEYAETADLIRPHKINYTDLYCPCEIYMLGEYHPYQPQHRWTRAIRHYKKEGNRELEDPLAVLMADYLYKRSGSLKEIDYIVPVPPDPEKFVIRENFAPNDDLAEKLGKLIATPVVKAILRKHTEDKTRQMSLEQKIEMYYIDDRYKNTLTGKGILIVEDITTSGGTILACIVKSLKIKPSSIYAIVLGETSG